MMTSLYTSFTRYYATSNLKFVMKNFKDIKIGDILRKTPVKYNQSNCEILNKNANKLFILTNKHQGIRYELDNIHKSSEKYNYSWNYFLGEELDKNLQIKPDGAVLRFDLCDNGIVELTCDGTSVLFKQFYEVLKK